MKRYISVSLLVLSALAISAPAQPGSERRGNTGIATKQTPPPESPVLGTSAVVRVLAVKDNASAQDAYLKPDAGNKLITVQIVVDNRKGTDDLTISPMYFRLKDEEGGVYEESWVINSTDEPSLKTGAVDAGDLVKGWISFIVPAAIKPKTLKLRYESFDNKTAWIPLSSLVK